MYFRYGNYQHPANEVTLAHFQIVPQRNQQGFRLGTHYSMHLEGELYVDDGITDKVACQANLTNKINTLINAYKDDYKDAGFYQDNGLPTPHVLPNNHPDNVTGNVISHRNWPMGDGNEYATKRTFTIGITALFKNSYSQIIEYQDRIQQVGDGGPVVEWYNTRFGSPGFQIRNAQSFVYYSHSGHMQAIDAYPIPPSPLYSRPYLLGDKTVIQRDSPKRYAQGYMVYTVHWTYHYILPNPSLILPTLR
jgi:hypothetical protein